LGAVLDGATAYKLANERKFGLRALVGLVEHNRAIVLRASESDVQVAQILMGAIT